MRLDTASLELQESVDLIVEREETNMERSSREKRETFI